MIPRFGLRATLSPDASNDLEDVWRTKTALRDLAFYRPPAHGMTTYPDVEMFDALRRFQGREGLRIDGVMRPDGPTQHRLVQRVAEKRAARKDTADPNHGGLAPRITPRRGYERAKEWAEYGAAIGKWIPFPGAEKAAEAVAGGFGALTGSFGNQDWPPYVDPNWGP